MWTILCLFTTPRRPSSSRLLTVREHIPLRRYNAISNLCLDSLVSILNDHRLQTWVLTGDEAMDTQLRKKHSYGSAPSMHLGKALLDLVGEPKKAGEACLVVCDRLSSGLPDRPSDEKLHTINLIQQLILYAKLQVWLSFSSPCVVDIGVHCYASFFCSS